MYASVFLIGAALAIAGVMGVLLPPGHRAVVVLALLAGAGVGIAGLAVGSASVDIAHGDSMNWWHVFFASSIAGFGTVVASIVLLWRRASKRSIAPSRHEAPANE